MRELRDAALAYARGAGAILAKYHHGQFKVAHKDTVDLITDADRASEDYILRQIARSYPGHAVLAEESGAGGADGPCRWIIDPLDGTTNFAHRLPYFSVLIAVQERQASGAFETVISVTHDPLRDESFVAERGGGAFLNDERIRVSSTSRLLDSVLATGFAVNRLFNPALDNHAEFCRLNLVTQAVRRFGSAGLDLAYVAAGRFDGFWEYGLHPWDTAGGALLVAEAGGEVTEVDGSVFEPRAGSICASNGRIHDALRAATASARAHPVNSHDGIEALLPAEVAAKLEGAR